ncbi:hypothetical protein JCM3770_001291 [Rhodotorula araucariae]
MAPQVVPPSSEFDWQKLAFDLYPTAGYVKYVWTPENGWGEKEWVDEPYLKMHISAVGIQYGCSCFEGLKAFRQEDGQVKLFRPDENAARLNHSGAALSMPEVPKGIFLDACNTVVARNLQFVPPHAPFGGAGSLYIRPTLLATGAELGLVAPQEFTFYVYVTPLGSLYGSAGGKAPAVDAIIVHEFDRAAPMGTGTIKAGGNYGPVLKYQAQAKKAGYAITLHLDSKTRTFIDEFSTSNFIAIKKRSAGEDKPTLVYPKSESILKSVTAKSLMDIARSLGWNVEHRPISFQEVIDGGLEEVMACGTAAAITPIRSITYLDDAGQQAKVSIGDGENAGPGTVELLQQLTGIQAGNKEAPANWLWPAEGVDASKA